ncbi:carbohydrate ABC transporter permease [Georgenia yuyongxinii]|uniref:Carbohydrate ABC transporter permease n=1 Tax=Georgenia yuyongxinii TaxID=2589797 RepID=A0A552WP68_9MICO|nr:carbohydrate ABC transporter permease [Georgenia yuyongxinii]TRW44507.1 carbohydrate ABC transporter permease [Georgenia yuyongxinii]
MLEQVVEKPHTPGAPGTRGGEQDGVRRPRRLRVNKLQVISVAVALLVVGYLLLPFFWMLKSAFQPASEITSIPPVWIPTDPSTENFRQALAMMPFARQMGNSLLVAGVAAVVGTLIASMAAYVTSRFRFKITGIVLAVFVFNQLVPEITRLFPVYFLLERLNLVNTYTGMILTYVGFMLPFAVLVLHGYFQNSCPKELEESAYVDGCSHFGAFLRVFLPVSRAGILSIVCVVFLQIWNDFIWASTLLYQGDKAMLQVGLRSFFGQGGAVEFMGPFMAACVLTMLPAVVLFVFVQRYMVSGLSSGAIKG